MRALINAFEGLAPDGAEAIGGIVLNNGVGGINPHAVNLCFEYGGRIVWMPTTASPAHIAHVEHGSTKFPSDPTYYNVGTGEILFDNVLIGDYEQLGPAPAGTGAASSFDGAGNPISSRMTSAANSLARCNAAFAL